MPRLSPLGVVVQGLGLVWWTPDLLIGQRQQPDGSWAVCSAFSVEGPWSVMVPRGCNFIAAGGGNWAAYGGSIFGPAAIPGAAIPAGLDGRGAGSADGTIALVADPQSGRGLILHRFDGSRVDVPDAYPTDRICVIDRDRALWWDAGTKGLRTCGGLPVPTVLPGPVLWPSVFFALDGWWIAYHSTDAIGYVCHPFDSFEGYAIAKPPAFYPSAMAFSPALARLAWSLDSAESSGALRLWDQDLTAPRVNLAPSTPVPVPSPDPDPSPDPTPTPVPPKEPMPPSFDQWIRVEFPQVLAAYQYGHPQPDGRPGTEEPGAEWAAFQTLRRYSGFIPGMGEAWTLAQMIAHERAQRPADAPADPDAPNPR